MTIDNVIGHVNHLASLAVGAYLGEMPIGERDIEMGKIIERLQTDAYAEGRKDECEAHVLLRAVAEQILDAGHMNTEDLAMLRFAWEAL